MTKNSFVVYHNYREKLQNLTNAQIGKLFRAMLDYAIDGKIPELKGILDIAFQFIKVTMDEDLKKYNEKCNKNKENIKRRWNTNVYERNKKIQTYTNDTDNDYDYDISLSNNNINNILSTRVRACANEKEIEEYLQEHFKSYFKYWGFDEQDKQTFNEIMQVLANAIEKSKTNSLNYYHTRYKTKYNFNLLIENISVLDDEDIHKIVFQILNNNDIQNRYLYILGAILTRANEKIKQIEGKK